MTVEAVRLRFPAKPEYLLVARLAVSGAVRGVALGQREIADVKLAVTEACSNAIRHGYAQGAPGEIELEVLLERDRVHLVVEDHGTGIALPVPEVAPSERGGMGLPLMRALVDHLEIRPSEEGKGTVVRMTKLAQRRARANGSPRGRSADV